MRCELVEVLLGDYADNVADERGQRIVERHIQLCSGCHTDLLLLRRLAHQLERVALLPIGVAARMPRYQYELERLLLARQRARRRRPLVAVAVVLVLLLEVASIWLVLLLAHNG
ncbi:MAG: zf-HC2 domain-containing protein [Ktedonobacteraceae bacterium]|nr:zf-HC2 domain-containing protein [Ktedonobacteraceae bacterium]